MRTVTTPQGSFLTGSVLAEAVLRFDAVLSDAGESAAVEFPIVSDEAKVERVLVTIGWRQCVESRASSADVDELTDQRVVRSLEERAARVAPRRGIAFSQQELADIDWTGADF